MGGGIANTFLAAAGHNVGKSLCEEDLVAEAQKLIDQAAGARRRHSGCRSTWSCGKEFAETAAAVLKKVDDVADDDMIFDVGPETAQQLAEILKNAGTIVWNGPVGVFEFDQFGEGTKAHRPWPSPSPTPSPSPAAATRSRRWPKYGI